MSIEAEDRRKELARSQRLVRRAWRPAQRFGEEQLGEIPAGFQQRGWTIHDILHVLTWHESHHHGLCARWQLAW
jgi:hypothetical protein